MSANSLARLWQSRGFVPDRLLFMTYVLNFRDFHDQVLRRLVENASGRRLRVDVIASCVDVEEESDCFDYRYLAPLGNGFRLFRCTDRPLVHAKAIIAQDSVTGKRLAGFGSANLTPGGWRHNVELWHWDNGRSLSAILRLCEALERSNGLTSGVAGAWRQALGPTREDTSIATLGVPNAPGFQKVLERLLGAVANPRIIRVASPYFDADSAELFERIARAARGCRLEIWTDRSGKLAEPTYWRVLSAFLPKLLRIFENVSVIAPKDAPWHAKVVELDDGRGRVARVFGSANFTGAAWGLRRPGNVELVAMETRAIGLPAMLAPRKIEMSPVLAEERRRLARQEEQEQLVRVRGPVLLWACLAEKPPIKIVARLARAERVVGWGVEGHFDESRQDDEKDRLRKIRDRVTDRTKWRLRESGREITLEWAGGEFIPSEHMSLKVRTTSGTCRAPIWIPEPDWSTRDGETGIPIAPDERSSIDALLRGPRPIVGFRQKVRDPEQEEEVTEELNIAPAAGLRMNHPDYDHEPEVMVVARHLQGRPDLVATMRRRLEAIARNGSPKDRLLAKVVLAIPKHR